jgi:2-keto-4-pentenoate hydratase/2-oxohepta-3-ene-1,7-dioic acid hydratase in catechol pathway
MANWIRYAIAADAAARFGTLQDGTVSEYDGSLFGEHRPTGVRHALQDVRLLAPCEPAKILALWNNFHELSRKLGKPPPSHPLYVIKPASSVAATGMPIRRPSGYEGKIVFEGELGIVIGRACRDVAVHDAGAFIFGYTCVNDVTAVQRIEEDPAFAQWTRAKCSDTFCCLGPSIATDLDWAAARVVTVVDGVERQNYPVADMILDPPRIVSAVSADMTLEAGDVIACGTSVGAGSLREGARVSVRIGGIGELHNRLGAQP